MMSSRPSSRATPGEESTGGIRSSTAKRPLTKPVAPRLSTSSTATKPTPTSSARTSTTASSSLSKPPARPTTTPSTSTVRRPVASTATAASSLHRARPSSASVEASGDEASRDGIAARPKRISTASSTAIETPTTTASKTTATPLRKSATSATSSTLRSSVKSPTSTKTPVPSTARTTSTVTSRTRPLSTSIARTAPGAVERKRLSTIPASPAVKRLSLESDENKENEFESGTEAAEPEEKSVRSLDGVLNGGKAGNDDYQDELLSLREELEESRGQVQQLSSHLAETKARMEYFSENVEQEAAKVQEATEAIRAEHAATIDELLALHKSQITELQSSHEQEASEVSQKHETELQTVRDSNAEHVSRKDVEVEALKAELNVAKSQDLSTSPQLTASEQAELANTRTQLEAMRERHQAAKNNAKDKMAKASGDHGQAIVALKDQHAEKIAEMQQKLDSLQNGGRLSDEELTTEKEAHADTLRQLQAAKNELGTIKKTSQENEVQSKKMKELREQLLAVEQSKAEENTIAEQSLNKLKSDHDAQLSKLRSELEQVKLKADKPDFAAQLEEAKAIASAKEEAHVKEISALQQQLEAAEASSVGQKGKHTEQILKLESQLSSRNVEFDALKNTHAEQLHKLHVDHDASSRAAIELMKTAHSNEIRELEKQSTSALRDLESLESSNNAYIEQIKNDAAVAQKKALEEQASSHKDMISALEEKLSAQQKEATMFRQTHGEELDKLKSDHEKVSEDMRIEQEREIADLKSQFTISNNALEALKSSHATDIQKLQSQVKSVADELDAANLQSRSLKGIMQNMEKDFAKKEEERQKELEQKNNDFSQAMEKLSAQSVRIAELEIAHRQAVEQAKAAVQAETVASLQALKQEHDDTLATQRKVLEDAHHAFLLTLRSEHSSAIDALSKEVDTRDHDIEQLKTQHAQALVELHTSAQKGNDAIVEQLKNDNSKALDDLKTTMHTEHQSSLDALRSQQASEAENRSKTHEESLSRAAAEHATAITALKATLKQYQDRLQDTSKLDTLQAQLSASQQAFTKLQEEQSATLSKMSKEYEERLSKLQSEIKVLEGEAEKAADTTESDGVKAELIKTKEQIAALANDHAEAVGKKDLDHASTVKALQSELDEAKAAASAAVHDSNEVEANKKSLADAKQTISELSEQYALASMEAENQRLAAESTKKELAELKKSLIEAKAVSNTSTEPATSSIKSPKGTPTTKSSPKIGLKDSRWASADSENETNESNTNQPQGLLIDHSPASADSHSQSTPSKPKKRNVSGQMASIKEQIRQLNEMNEEVLADHQKWARSLSRVDDDGNVTGSIAEEDGNTDQVTKK